MPWHRRTESAGIAPSPMVASGTLDAVLPLVDVDAERAERAVDVLDEWRGRTTDDAPLEQSALQITAG